MARFESVIDIDAPSEVIFDLMHDYDRRLEWDTLLAEARLQGGATEAGVGVRSLCVGRSSLLRLGVETVYVTFERPDVAAVRMTDGPWIFARFAASIRHEPLPSGATRVTYKGDVVTRPAWLRWLVEPLVVRRFQRETVLRLEALRAALERT